MLPDQCAASASASSPRIRASVRARRGASKARLLDRVRPLALSHHYAASYSEGRSFQNDWRAHEVEFRGGGICLQCGRLIGRLHSLGAGKHVIADLWCLNFWRSSVLFEWAGKSYFSYPGIKKLIFICGLSCTADVGCLVRPRPSRTGPSSCGSSAIQTLDAAGIG